MINAANFTPSINSTNNMTNSVAPVKKKYVIIDGKKYPVQKVQDNNSMVKSFAPSYKEVVVIDGKQYDVNEIPDNIACDKTKQVVVVDGQQYDVENENSINLNGGFTFNPSTRVNPDSKMSYIA